ncbi:aldo/keto reductase [Vibrio sp. UCD-FRSSP16_10]|uniref:aldo/keto reductase n=1 Tax=unclassified Vibrio TaxID=2614977 RepID=UPI0007FDD2FC|nr:MULTISPECIES: aldo/keto reductase [unclassified Vibrio]OBT08533.1 aldo/keto reductase [Vibrio sp. UCD-FRSSP16_30]OBT18063.1 aldo/keto reductase [Vibrio sp. UCD-FRSSP16_10]
MEYAKLGHSGLDVSRVCLGSMTWGVQNNQQDADLQINYALEQGVNFIDTAEMYAIPATPDTYGKTESIIGDWVSRHQSQRQDVIIASKIAGPGMHWVRDGGPITGESVIASVEQSLKRLQTDYIDLYQLHWPNRTSPHFGKQWPNQFSFTEVDTQAQRAQMLEILQALNECIAAGKIRHCGLSDETTWGISTYLELAEKHSLPKMVSIQNEFSLLCQKDWPYLIEHCHHNDVAYLPWSPLATGLLSGKYANNARPNGSRWSLMNPSSIYRSSALAHEAVAQYCHIANDIGITPAQLALAWCNQVQGVTSSIIGATSLPQLKENISAFDITLDTETCERITQVIKQYPAPY